MQQSTYLTKTKVVEANDYLFKREVAIRYLSLKEHPSNPFKSSKWRILEIQCLVILKDSVFKHVFF